MHPSLIGDKGKSVYHLPLCSQVESIADENEIWFDSASSARESGYIPCDECNPHELELPDAVESDQPDDTVDSENGRFDRGTGVKTSEAFSFPCPQCLRQVAEDWAECPYCHERLMDVAVIADEHSKSEQDNSLRAEYHLQRADELEEAGEFDKALIECDAAIALDSSLADAYNLRGIVYQKMGQVQRAVNAYQQALKCDPEFEEARENLANLDESIRDQLRLVTIGTYNSRHEADLQKTRLETEGIPVILTDASLFSINWLNPNTIGGVNLQVEECHVQRALQIIDGSIDSE